VQAGVVALDWDGALRQGFLIADWSEFLLGHSEIDPAAVVSITQQLAEYDSHLLSYSSIAQGIPRLYASGVQGRSASRHQHLARSYIETEAFRSRMSPAAAKLFEFLARTPNVMGVIVSGGPDSVLRPFAENVGIVKVYAVELEQKRDTFTGLVLDNPAVAERKGRSLRT
jgi:phosphoserine phosphatase